MILMHAGVHACACVIMWFQLVSEFIQKLLMQCHDEKITGARCTLHYVVCELLYQPVDSIRGAITHLARTQQTRCLAHAHPLGLDGRMTG